MFLTPNSFAWWCVKTLLLTSLCPDRRQWRLLWFVWASHVVQPCGQTGGQRGRGDLLHCLSPLCSEFSTAALLSRSHRWCTWWSRWFTGLWFFLCSLPRFLELQESALQYLQVSASSSWGSLFLCSSCQAWSVSLIKICDCFSLFLLAPPVFHSCPAFLLDHTLLLNVRAFLEHSLFAHHWQRRRN